MRLGLLDDQVLFRENLAQLLASKPEFEIVAEWMTIQKLRLLSLSPETERLIQAITLVANGKAWVDRKVIQLIAERYPHTLQR
jgi:hypothetical protein